MKRLLIASIVITILLILCSIDDFLSLHDIKADYVSKSVLTSLQVKTSEPLPAWTDTSLEWTSVSISYTFRSLLILANLGILLVLTKRFPRPTGSPQVW